MGSLRFMPASSLHAFIDEAGQRARTAKSSAHFVMSAAVIPDERLGDCSTLLRGLRTDLRRSPTDVLHWRNVKTHTQRLHIAKTLGSVSWLTISSVVVCKQHLTGSALDDDTAYLYTLRYLLERLSWLACAERRVLTYTLSHVVRFKTSKLRAYEGVLRAMPDCQVAWPWLEPTGGHIDQPSRVENLQLADSAASATFAAFECDDFGNTEVRYLREMSPCLYRRPGGKLTSYGLKMHPWNDATRAAYPWVAAL